MSASSCHTAVYIAATSRQLDGALLIYYPISAVTILQNEWRVFGQVLPGSLAPLLQACLSTTYSPHRSTGSHLSVRSPPALISVCALVTCWPLCRHSPALTDPQGRCMANGRKKVTCTRDVHYQDPGAASETRLTFQVTPSG